MARVPKRTDDDDTGRDFAPIDLAPFRPTGEAIELHAYPACRAIMAVAAAMDPDEPVLQVELYQRGAVFMGTDRWSYLTAYVPYPTNSLDWVELEDHASDWPEPGDSPLSVITCLDPLGLLARWAALYGKPKRAKESPSERISVQVGRRIDDDQPTLSDDMAPEAVRFGGPDTTTTVTRTPKEFDWHPMAQPDWAKPAPAGWVRTTGQRQAQLGKLAALDPEGIVATRPKVLPAGGWVIEVSTGGYPEVRGHVMAVKPT